jgi:hypothetical protein
VADVYVNFISGGVTDGQWAAHVADR